MKKKKLWRRAASAVLGGLLCVSITAVGCAEKKGEGEGILSYGVHVLAAETDMAISVLRGNEAVFSAEVFARSLNLSHVDYITVHTLPDDTDGELLLGSTRVAAGQRIASSNLSYLTFAAASEAVSRASFTFSANGSEAVMDCNVYLLDVENYTPTLAAVPELARRVFTYRDTAAYGTLTAYDPDGDEMVFEIVSYPQNGALTLTDAHAGTYVYAPSAGYTGTDSFSYVARDIYGNYSACASVELRVDVAGTSVTYADMEDSRSHTAARALTEAGIMSGTQVGNQHYFYPDRTVTRAEFLVMAMNVAGITDVPTCEATAFADDASIPQSMKGYVAAAYTLGYISGTNVQGDLCFLPDEEITRAQAAVMLESILDVSDARVISVFADHSEIPVWASDALYSLHAVGILRDTEGCISATQKLTRAETADMLFAVSEYCMLD
ncbi:MAG: S-layer homology domain-containing protein [Clostridia bacterium]|nr:S-layer homology domain-containing protein [Clostridia bacterium]